jgi:tetratricopeptide (TPR) repeat protein
LRALDKRARGAYREALDELVDARDDVESLLELSRLREELGQYDEAERVAACSAAFAHTTRLAPLALARVASVARSQRRFRAAEQTAVEATSLARRGSDGAALAETLAERGAARLELARFSEAKADFQEAARLVSALPPGLAINRTRFMTRVGLGGIARDRGLYAEAEAELRRAIADAERDFGDAALERAWALNGLGMVFKYAGRFDEALELYKRALVILVAAVGGQHPDVASIYHNLGGLEHARARYDEAEPHARRSTEIRRAAIGADHPAVAEDEAAHASILFALGRDDEAEPLLRHGIAVLTRALGPNHPEVAVNLNNLAALLQRQGNLTEAEATYRRALTAKEQTIGCDHPSVATTLSNLGVVVARLGKPDEAEALYRRALSIFGGRVEPSHPNLLRAARNLAKLLRDGGRDADARMVETRWKIQTPPAVEREGGQSTEGSHIVGDPTKAEQEVEAHGLAAMNLNETAVEDANDDVADAESADERDIAESTEDDSR